MALVYVVLCALRRCLEFVGLLLDVNVWLAGCAVRLLAGLISLLHTVPALLGNAALGLADGLRGPLHLVAGVSESCKMLGHLLSHAALRARELLHRGLLTGQAALRQLFDACAILCSLALYLVNTAVNLALIGVQGAWEAMAGPAQEALELAVALLTFLHSGLVGTSLLLWTPCRLALELLASLCHVFATVFLLNLYGLLLTVTIVAVATLYLNPGLPLGRPRSVDGDVPGLRRLQRALYRLYLLALERAQSGLEAGVWQRGSRAQTRTPPTRQEQERVAEEPAPPPLPIPSPPESLAGDAYPEPGLQPGLLSLLKEHEERKKCVICQDCAKTVLLLPCRHLCLCRRCADILLQHPAAQHSCPLCRHAIAHTMDVYL